MRPLLLSALLACLLPVTTPAGQEPDPWDRLLESAGLTRATCRFDVLDMANFGGGEYRLGYFDALHRAPLRTPFYLRSFRHSVQSATGSMGNLVMQGSLRLDEGTRLTLIGDPLQRLEVESKAPGSLLAAIRSAVSWSGKKVSAQEEALIKRGLQAVPASVQQVAAFLVLAELQSLKWHAKSFAAVGADQRQRLFDKLTGVTPDIDSSIDTETYRLMQSIDLKYLLTGAQLLALAVDRAAGWLAEKPIREEFRFDVETPLGRIAIHGGQADSYPAGAYSLILDTGGKDQYRGGGGTYDSSHPVSVLLDVNGDDLYAETQELVSTPVAKHAGRKKPSAHPVFGSGVMGYGILADLSGNDVYRSLSNSQGRGLFGCGVLADRSGSDRYDCYVRGQGSAKFGVGILADGAGADEYRCFTSSQGMGETKGFGLLADGGTEPDLYEANDTVIDFPSPQTDQHNANLSQGCGFGRRADYTDGHSLAGGIGALVDGGGDNTFTAGLFAQGAGYWYGLGILSSGQGADRYRGAWYVQAASAHFAVGLLSDDGGNDNYLATMNMAQGAGHDFSVGFLLDAAGDDLHEAPNLSLGGGNANGFGFFWDRAGNDTYRVTPSTTLGRASIEDKDPNNLRARCVTLGIFLDSGGSDTYPDVTPWAKNNGSWTMRDSGPGQLPAQRGAGLDIEASSLGEPE